MQVAVIRSETGGSYMFTGLTAGTNYEIYVEAINNNPSVSVLSDVCNVITLPGSFNLNPATGMTTTSCNLSWGVSGSATQYSYTINGGSRVYVQGVMLNPARTCAVNNLAVGSTNIFAFRAHNASGFTDANGTISVLLLPGPPTGFSITHALSTWTPYFSVGAGATSAFYSRHVDTNTKTPITSGTAQNYPAQTGSENWVNIYLYSRNATGDSPAAAVDTLYFPPGPFNIYDADINYYGDRKYKLAMNLPRNVTRITVYKNGNFDHVVNVNQTPENYNGNQVIFDDVIGDNIGHGDVLYGGVQSPFRGHVRAFAYNTTNVEIEASKGTWDGWVGT